MPFKKLKPEEHGSPEALIAAIERKDRRFRLFQTVFMVATFIALMVIIGAQQRTLDGVRDQLTQAKQIASDTAKRSKDQQDTILRRLDCMSVFFSQRDRQGLSIENIDKCTLNRDGDIQRFFIQQPGEAPETTREQQPNLPQAPESNQGPNPQGPVDQVPLPPFIEPRDPPLLDLPLLNLPKSCVLELICLQ